MEHELWAILSRAVHDVARHRRANAYHDHEHATVVRVYLWAQLHDRPVCWACQPRHWSRRTLPRRLPSQSTMSRRLRSALIADFLATLGRRLQSFFQPTLDLLKIIDGKALLVSRHSQDADATWGPTGAGKGRGYKLHVIWGGGAMPTCCAVRPLNQSEKDVAAAMMPQLTGAGYLLGDAFYHSSRLFNLAAQHGYQLLAPRSRSKRYGGLRRGRHSVARLRSIALLEPTEASSGFGRTLFAWRDDIERRFGHLCSFGAGLTGHLPSWARGLGTVRRYVMTKLIINAARIRANRA